MEQLKELHQKNSLLMKLPGHLPSAESRIFVDTLLAMFRALGPETLQHLKTLKTLLPLLDDVLLEAMFEGEFQQGPVQASGKMDAMPGCHATIEGVDLAQSALEDFINSYYMFHNLNANSGEDVLKYSPFLGFIESHIYDLDQANEDYLHPAMITTVPLEDPFSPLRRILQERTWLSPEISQELEDGARFWALERKICRALASKSPVSQEEAKEALRLKSFDYRAMNLLLYKMRGEEPCQEHMEFLATSEVLVEIGDDLVDYYEDIERNSFNIYRCFVVIHGPELGAQELRNFIASAERAYAAVFSRLKEGNEPLAAKWLQRNQSSRRHSSGSEKPEGASWEIPPAVEEK